MFTKILTCLAEKLALLLVRLSIFCVGWRLPGSLASVLQKEFYSLLHAVQFL